MTGPGTATSTVLTVLAFRVALRPETSLTGLSVGFERNDLNDGICFIVLAVTGVGCRGHAKVLYCAPMSG